MNRSEIGDEESYYEVEVTLDGSQVDVHLDEDFLVVATAVDTENDTDDSGED